MNDDIDWSDKDDDIFKRLRHLEDAPHVHPELREEYSNVVDEIEWYIKESDDVPRSMIEARVKEWEFVINKMIAMMPTEMKVKIHIDEEQNLGFEGVK